MSFSDLDFFLAMSTGDALQSPSTTATSQITGKRKRVGSIDETGNAEDDQDDGHRPRQQNQNLHDFLLDIVEILRRLVSISLFPLAGIANMLSSLPPYHPSVLANGRLIVLTI